MYHFFCIVGGVNFASRFRIQLSFMTVWRQARHGFGGYLVLCNLPSDSFIQVRLTYTIVLGRLEIVTFLAKFR